jgi:DNA-binding CsgD family transcriptional regulator
LSTSAGLRKILADQRDVGGKLQLDTQILNEREREVLTWLAKGKDAAAVAIIMGLSAATVMYHCREAQKRLGTLNRTHTVAVAIGKGFIPAPSDPHVHP